MKLIFFSINSNSLRIKLLLCASLLAMAPTAMAEEKGFNLALLMEMAIPKPHELELARKRLAESNIEKAWERPCPYYVLDDEYIKKYNKYSPESKEYYYRCERWETCKIQGGSTSIYTEGFYRNHQAESKGKAFFPWETMRNGQAFLLDESSFEYAEGHLRRYGLKFAEENWRLFEGRSNHEASDMVEQKFWQWCSVQPLSLWEADDDHLWEADDQ